MNVGLRTARRSKVHVPGSIHVPHVQVYLHVASGGRMSYSPSIECVQCGWLNNMQNIASSFGNHVRKCTRLSQLYRTAGNEKRGVGLGTKLNGDHLYSCNAVGFSFTGKCLA